MKNKIICGDCLEILKKIDDESIDLIISDPPYFRIKGEFDFKWKTFDDYLKDVEKWAVECKRVLKETGTLFWFGDDKNIAYSQIIFDKYFGLLNSLVWWKTNFSKGMYGSANGELIRCFAPCTERILMYSNDVYNLTQCVNSVRDYIRSEIIRAKGKIVLKDINVALGVASNGGGVASACLSLDKAEPTMFTKEMYEKLRDWLNRKEYEYLRKEYEDLRRPFNNKFNLTEVLQFDSDTRNIYEHETIKPLELIEKLIITCSNENDLILDPFLGSGTTAVASQELHRNFIGIEISPKYVEIARQRLRQKPLL